MQNSLFLRAIANRANSYAPYSNYFVGAALLTKDGRIFDGANLENAAYPMCLCAERTAFATALFQGHREFTAIAIAGGKTDEEARSFDCAPCGACRQVMAEFCDKDFQIILANKTLTLGDLLPESFSL